MLKIFRKYQKVLFSVIIFFIVISFAFFGVNGAISKTQTVQDKKIATAIDGSKIYQSEVQLLSNFLRNDQLDAFNQIDNQINLFNNSVIKNDILSSKIFEALVDKYFDEIKPFFDKNFDKIKNFKPYVHKYDKSINMKNIWDKFNPEMNIKLNKLQSYTEVTKDYIIDLSKLYIEESRLSNRSIKNVLMYEENSKKNIQRDPRIVNSSLTLFNNKNFVDWFGVDTLDLISQFILNASKKAKSKNYKISYEEVVAELKSNLKKALPKEEDLQTVYERQLNILGFNEKLAYMTYSNIVLFRKYLKDTTDAIIVDNLTLNELSNFSNSIANITKYELSDEYNFKNLDDLLKFEMYLKATCIDNSFEYKDFLEIEKDFPEFLYTVCNLEIKETNLEKAALKIKLQDMDEWQLDNENFKKITKNFPQIKYQIEKENKIQELKKIDQKLKDEIDNFSRNEIVRNDNSFIDKSLNDAAAKNIFVNLNLKNPVLPLNIKNTKDFLTKLESSKKIDKYSEDNKTFYQVNLLNKDENKKILSFKEAVNDKVIDITLDNFLKTYYEKNIDKFKKDDGSSKKFNEVKDEIKKIAFEKTINHLKSKHNIKDLNSLAKYRMYDFMQDNLNNLKENKKEIKTSHINLISKKLEIEKSKNLDDFEKRVFSQKEKTFSDIMWEKNEKISFYYLDKIGSKQIANKDFESYKTKLNSEAAKILITNFIKDLKDNNSIVLSTKE
jgi:hypothetical protein